MSKLNTWQNSRTLRLGLALAFGLALLIGLLLAMGAARPPEVALAQGTTRYVAPAPTGNDSGNDCTTSSTPCATVQHAVDVADPDDEIRVATGTYTDVHGRPAPSGAYYGHGGGSDIITQVVYISQSLAIRGGYTTAFTDPPDSEANPTTLNAQGQGRGLLITGDISATIEGLHITGGDATGLGGYLKPWIEIPSDAGGGIYASGAAVTLSHNQVFSNTAGGGGGLYLGWNDAIFVSGHTVTTNSADYGGGLYLDFSDATLSDNTVTTNSASVNGGGLYLFNSNAALSRNAVSANTADYGGGLYLWGDDGPFSENTVTANTAASGGGGLYLILSDATLTNNFIADNQANIAGSGLRIVDSSPNLMHNTIARNGSTGPVLSIVEGLTAGSGGGGSGIYIYHNPFNAHPSNVTLTNNILVSHSVGITVSVDSAATLEATLWGSGSWANGTDWDGAGSIATGTVNLWGDPAFVDPDVGDYHIGPGSAAFDAGVNAGVTADIDGEPRPFGAGYDLGADEAQATPALTVTKYTSPDPMQVGEPLTYTIRVTNTGNVTLTTTITDILPNQVTPTGVLTWTPTITAPDGVWTQQVVVTVETGYAGLLTNVVRATTEEGATGIYTNTTSTTGYSIYLPVILKDSG